MGDFGFSTQISSREDTLATFCGSPPYAAPELFKDENYQGPLVDIWALGVLLYFMVTGTMPFKAQTVAALKKMILDGSYPMPPFLSEECRSLISNILQQNPRERYSIQQIKSSDWLKDEIFPVGLPKYNVHPSCEPETVITEDETRARQYLLELGLTEDLMKDCADKGARSNVTGTYRIVLHRLQAAAAVVKGPGNGVEEEDECLGYLENGANANKIGNGTTSKLSRMHKKFSFSSCQNGKRSRTCVLL